jgi:hypothetical protein
MVRQDPMDRAQQPSLIPSGRYSYLFAGASAIHTPPNSPGGIAGAFTISAWINEKSVDARYTTYFDQGAYDSGGNADRGWVLQQGEDNLVLKVGNGSTYTTIASSANTNLPANKPVYLTVAYDGSGNWQIDENGARVGSGTASWKPNPAVPYINIGRQGAHGWNAVGYLENIRLWNSGLTTAQDLAMYNADFVPPLLTETPAQADSFVDGIGVNTHFDYHGTPYDTNFVRVRTMLVNSGIRHIRDGGNDTRASATLRSRYATLAADGITYEIGVNHGESDSYILSQIAVAPKAFMIEPDNEYDGSNDPTWVNVLRIFQQRLYADVKGSAFYNGVTVLGPSLVDDRNALRLGDLSQYMDAGNVHIAPPGVNPGDSSLRNALSPEQALSGNKPIWVTETGYDSNISHRQALPDDVIAKYDPRLIATWWQLGVRHVFFYQFSNMSAADSMFGFTGLIDDNGNPKPQYTAIQSMISLLSDRGLSFTPRQFAFTLSGSLSNVQHLTLQKRDGSTWLLLWIELPGYTWQTHTYTPVPPQSVSIQLATIPASATSYTYNADGTLQTHSLSVDARNTISLQATDSITFLRLSPPR